MSSLYFKNQFELWKTNNYINNPNKEKEGWHYLSVKRLSALLREITSKYKGNFYCLNHLLFFRAENKLKSHEKLYKNKIFCGIAMPSEKDNILVFNQYMKSNKMPHIIYAGTESLIKETDVFGNNPEKSLTTKISEHISYGYSMSTIWVFDHIESKHTLYRWKDYMKRICESLWEYAKNIIDFEEKWYC